jgi:hypothetical protein
MQAPRFSYGFMLAGCGSLALAISFSTSDLSFRLKSIIIFTATVKKALPIPQFSCERAGNVVDYESAWEHSHID